MSCVTLGKGAFTSSFTKQEQECLFQLPMDPLGSQPETVLWKHECCAKPGRHGYSGDGLGVSPREHAVPKLPAMEFQLSNPGQAKQVSGRQELHGVVERHSASNRQFIIRRGRSLTLRIRDNGLSTLET